MPRPPAGPSLADPSTHPSLQFLAGELHSGRLRKLKRRKRKAAKTEVAIPPAEVVTPAVPVAPPRAVKPSALPLPSPSVLVLSAADQKRADRRERRTRRRIRAARLRARWAKVSPYFAAQLCIFGLAVGLAEWLEVRVEEPLLCRFIAALGTSFATALLWSFFLRRQRTATLL